MVAVVVPSPATSEVLLATSFTICAPMFSRGSLSSISFATVTPSLVIKGEPNFLSRTTLRPLGPSVTLTASARRLTPRRIDCRDSSPYVICFAMFLPASSVFSLGRLSQHRQDFVLAEDQDILTIDLDLGPGVLSEQDLVAHLDVQGDLGAVFENLAVAHGQDLALLGLLLGGVGNDDPSLGRLLLLDAADDQAVVNADVLSSRSPFDQMSVTEPPAESRPLRKASAARGRNIRGDSGTPRSCAHARRCSWLGLP